MVTVAPSHSFWHNVRTSLLNPPAPAPAPAPAPTPTVAPVEIAPLPEDKRSAAQLGLDALFDLYHPKFTVTIDGKTTTVAVRAQFRMVGATGQPEPKLVKERLNEAFTKHKLWNTRRQPSDRVLFQRMAMGRGTPNDVRYLTQLLIDAGYLNDPKVVPQFIKDPEERVRYLQWYFGIGLDCIGYTAQGVAAAHGKKLQDLGLWDVISNGEGFYAPALPSFKKVAITDLRAGDVFRLEEYPEPGVKTSSHNVVVYDRQVLTDADRARLDGDTGVLADGGNIHVITIDSSWGTDGDPTNPHGGVDRQRWLYNDKTKKWAELDGTTVRDTEGPYDHQLIGTYRLR